MAMQQNEPKTLRLSSPASAGFACMQLAVFATVAFILHMSPALRGWPGEAVKIFASATILCGLFFPFYAAASPAPANGPKLIIFSAATFLSLMPWIPPGWMEAGSVHTFLAILIICAIAGNLLYIVLPSALIAPAPYAKPVEWRVGGKLMIAVLAIGLATALADRFFPLARSGSDNYRFVSIVLFAMFNYFLATRLSLRPAVVLVAVVVAIAAPLIFMIPLREPALQLFESALIPAAALAVGVQYAASHVSRTGSLVWALICIVLQFGAVAVWPAIGIPLASAMIVYMAHALAARRAFAATLLMIIIVLAAVLLYITWDEFAKVVSLHAKGNSGLFILESGIWSLAFAALLTLDGIVVTLKNRAWRLRTSNPVVAATFAAGAASLATAYFFHGIAAIMIANGIIQFSLLAATRTSAGEVIIGGDASESPAFQ